MTRGLLGAALAAAWLAAGCGSARDAERGTFELRVTDAVVDGAERVVVTFDRVELIGHPDGPVTVWQGFETVDLLSLRNCVFFDLVPPASVPAGTYGQVRLHIVSRTDPRFVPRADVPMPNFVDPIGPEEAVELRVPSGEESGAKIVGPFVVPPGGTLPLLADFDLRKSLHLVEPGRSEQGFLLRPVVRVVEGALAGAIRSHVVAAGTAPPAPPGGAVVYAWRDLNGDGALTGAAGVVDGAEVVASAVPDPAAGAFCIGPLAPGRYHVTALARVTTDLEGRDVWDGAYGAVTRTDVEVRAGERATPPEFVLVP